MSKPLDNGCTFQVYIDTEALLTRHGADVLSVVCPFVVHSLYPVAIFCIFHILRRTECVNALWHILLTDSQCEVIYDAAT